MVARNGQDGRPRADGLSVGRGRTDIDGQVAELLRTARSSLGLPLAFLSRLDGTTQTLEVVESAAPALVRDGITRPQATSLCQAVPFNVSPVALLDPGCGALLRLLPAERALLELSEHDPVDDYDALADVLGPLRARGLRLAIDDGQGWLFGRPGPAEALDEPAGAPASSMV